MKKLGLVQPNFRQGPKELNAYYLPYSVGTLWAYVKQFKEITNEYKLNSIVWRRDHIDKIIDRKDLKDTLYQTISLLN